MRAIAFELNQGVDFKEAANDLNILNINYEEYNITLLLDNGKTLHQYRYRINLFDNDRTYNWATMYDENGVDVADLRIDKTKLSYDPVRNVITIIEAGLYLDFSDFVAYLATFYLPVTFLYAFRQHSRFFGTLFRFDNGCFFSDFSDMEKKNV